MRDGRWRTLQEISNAAFAPPASVSAQLRHLRKKRFGGHTVEKAYLGRGLFSYRVVINRKTATPPKILKGVSLVKGTRNDYQKSSSAR